MRANFWFWDFEAERAGMRPRWEIEPKRMPKRAFGDYLEFSNETFTVREVRKLWAITIKLRS